MGPVICTHDPANPGSLQHAISVDIQLLRRQFGDSELAAEYWRAERDVLEIAEYSAFDGWFNDRGEMYLSDDAALAWRDTMQRFSTRRAENF